MALDDWGTTSSYDHIRPTLVERARGREVKRTGTKEWLVGGKAKKGDSFGNYEVILRDSERYQCACQLHHGGQYRKICSHIVAVMMFREEQPDAPYEIVEVGPIKVEPRKVIPFPADRSLAPAYVDDTPDAKVIPFSNTAMFDSEIAPPLTHPIFGSPPLPAKFKVLYPHQWKAVREILDELNDGRKVVLVDAPTGAGKSLLGEIVRRLYIGQLPTPYLCSTKSLQNQIEKEFPYAKVLKGRANYPTLERPDLTADDCSREKARLPACVNCPEGKGTESWARDQHTEEVDHCFACHPFSSCPYQVAKEAATLAPLSVLNVAYFLAETQGYGSKFAGRELVIIDESDVTEDELLRYVEITLAPRTRKQLGIKTLPKKTVEEDWVRWVRDDVLPAINRELVKLDKGGQQEFSMGLPPDPHERRHLKRMRDLDSKYRALLKPVEIEDPRTGEKSTVPELLAGWVYEWGGKDNPDDVYASFKPVRVGRLARTALWPKANQFLLMTATPISAQQLLEDDLGLEEGEWATVEMKSTFPPERRPIIVDSRANMRYSKAHGGIDPAELVKMRVAIDELIAAHPGQRVLVHTVSYTLTKYLYEHSTSDRVMTYWNSRERDAALAQFLDRADSVLLAPSFERGIDLPQEDCFPPGTLVRTSKGYRPIEDIKVGDRVWTHKRRYRKVLATSERPYEGKMIEVDPVGGPTVLMTPRHPVLISKWGRPRSFRLPSGQWISKGKTSRVSLDFVAAKDLTGDEMLALPVGDALRTFKPLGAAHASGHRRTSTAQTPNQWKDNTDFWWLVGLWAAEGSASSASYPRKSSGAPRKHWQIVWSMGAHEESTLAKECARVVGKVFGRTPPAPYTYGSGCTVFIKSDAFAVWLKKNVGRGAANKTVPSRLLRHPDASCRQAFLDGYAAGDGHWDGTRWTAVSASQRLALTVRDLALGLGYRGGVREKVIDGVSYWESYWNPNDGQHRSQNVSSRYLIAKPNSVREVDYSGTVHNLEVDRDQSYTLVGFGVHNCRLIIVAKTPYPSLGDKRWQKRLYAGGQKGQQAYIVKTIRTLAQMTGRGMRSANDFCKSVILDSQFRKLYMANQKLFPSWWRDAVILGQHDPRSRARLDEVAAIEEEINGRRQNRPVSPVNIKPVAPELPDPF